MSIRRLADDSSFLTANSNLDTIAFVGEKDKDKEFMDVLRTIARETGGTFRRVSESDL
ncbi:MAG TPA: hypothetical protein VIM11_00600 [Tepidisphaeraceae bacterium]